MLSLPWKQRQNSYEFIVVGSGYGGAITAARISAALNQPHAVCILERGKEWIPGEFPDDMLGVLANTRSDLNRLGLYEFLNYRDISVIKGSGLGGTSLINANVAIVPDREVFDLADWPRTLRYDDLLPYYERARAMLAANPVPGATDLLKVQALERRARQLGTRAGALNVAVNFDIEGPNPHNVVQHPCVKCGDCVSGCNFAAKNTLCMNYLPFAAAQGTDIFTQTKVEWVEKLAGGGWRIHGRYFRNGLVGGKSFRLDARNVVLSAGAINSTEILLRSEMHGLRVSPALGTGFSGNGDFFGLAYNGDYQTDVLGYGRSLPRTGEPGYPGPSIVGVVRYNGSSPVEQRITVEDFSFPSAYVAAAKTAFAALRGEPTTAANEDEQRQRLLSDLNPLTIHNAGGALNHTMLYLVMGQDNARGTMNIDAPWYDPDGRMTIEWDNAGQQIVFRRMNEELRRHARASGASYISNPTWNMFQIGHLITAHPLGGCPMGEDHLHGAVDEFGRVFSGDGSIHDGLFVQDGAIIPSALGVNPFLTISALAERNAERHIQALQGNAYPEPNLAVSTSAIDPLDVLGRTEFELEKLFRRCETEPLAKFVNAGGPPQIDMASRTIRNDAYWMGFFPKGHVLNAMSSAIFTGFKKTFFLQGGKMVGITSDTDGRITAHNSLEEIEIGRKTGTLEPGKYILLRYLDAPWAGFYDVFKMINDELLIGRVYLGEFPNGLRIFTFPMTRRYGFEQMTVADHTQLFESGAVPSKEELNGVWRMDVISNNNQLAGAAYLSFEHKPDGRLESRYQLMGLIEGLIIPGFTQDHFQLNDFTIFHDEIRKIDGALMVGRYITGTALDLSSLFNGANLGILHSVPGTNQFGFYYTLTKTGQKSLGAGTLLKPFLDVHLPDGIGMTFEETMQGWYFEGVSAGDSSRRGDLAIAAGVPGQLHCSFQVQMVVRDVNEFIGGAAHEAGMTGTISFDRFEGADNVRLAVDEEASAFRYLVMNPAAGEAEMQYELAFETADGKRYLLKGRKYMQRTGAGGPAAIRELLNDYTTLYARLYQRLDQDQLLEKGVAYLKFRTFEDLAAAGNLAGFLASFRITGTDDPLLQLSARMRFLAFTAQFVQAEYDPLSPDTGTLSEDVRVEVLRGADTPDYFTTVSTPDLQAILLDTPTLELEKLINTGVARVDIPNRRIFRDIFWKGSFAKDTLLGWEERVRASGLGDAAAQAAGTFAPGSFWKRFDTIRDGVLAGRVVNYDFDLLPGDPEVRRVEYPDDNRRYFRKGDPVLLLNYRNDPYRMVYDTIKLVDENNAIGVMHLGTFPEGLEFATFVMSRYGYPLEAMSAEDHHLIFSMPDLAPPAAGQLTGEWDGSLILQEHPNTSLLTKVQPALFHLSANELARFGIGLPGVPGEFSWTIDTLRSANEMRMIDADLIVGKWTLPSLSDSLLPSLRNFVEPCRNGFVLYYILKRAGTGFAP